MKDYKKPEYTENQKPVDEKYNNILGTPVNERYSALIYAKIKELEKIHQGGHFSIGVFTIEVEGEDGKRNIYVVKKVRIPESSIEYIETFKVVKESGLPTFGEAFVLSGDYPGRRSEDTRKGKVYFVSTLLNSEDRVILATNIANRNFPLNIDSKNYEEIFKNKLRIKNFQELIQKIIFKLVEAYNKYGIYMEQDSIFFSVPVNHKQEEVEIEWLIGDFDWVYYNIKKRFPYKTICKEMDYFYVTMRKFIETYCALDKANEYKQILDKEIDAIKSKFKSDKNNHLFN